MKFGTPWKLFPANPTSPLILRVRYGVQNKPIAPVRCPGIAL